MNDKKDALALRVDLMFVGIMRKSRRAVSARSHHSLPPAKGPSASMVLQIAFPDEAAFTHCKHGRPAPRGGLVACVIPPGSSCREQGRCRCRMFTCLRETFPLT